MRATFAAMTKILGEDTPGVPSNAVKHTLLKMACCRTH